MIKMMEANTHKGTVTCTREMRGKDEVFVMRGRSGKHELSADCTDHNRLMVHWAGFIRNHGGLWAVRK